MFFVALLFLHGVLSAHHFDQTGISEDLIARFHEKHGLRFKRSTNTDFEKARKEIALKAVKRAVCLSKNILTFTQNILDHFNIAPKDRMSFIKNVPNKRRFCTLSSTVRDCLGDSNPPHTPDCNPSYPYRTLNGTCNNLKNRLWGSSGMTYGRFGQPPYEPAYDDGVNSLRGATKKGLPTPREVSVTMNNNPVNVLVKTSHMLMQFGQFIDHDLVKTPEAGDIDESMEIQNIECCEDGISKVANGECQPIDVEGDSFFDITHSLKCRRFVRSLLTTDTCELGHRDQLNLLTSFLDASNVYGSSDEELNCQRSFQRGTLLFEENKGEKRPCNESSDPYCNLIHYTSGGKENIYAGDERVLEAPGLTSIHTVFMRLHNRIASMFYNKRNSLSDEYIFQESRRIVAALIQSITYSEFLPIILGSDGMTKYNLRLQTRGKHSRAYNPSINPTIKNVFASAAFRFGHSLIQDLLEVKGKITKFVNLSEKFFKVKATTEENEKPSNYMEGMCDQESAPYDHSLGDTITHKLFAEAPLFAFGIDLYAANIQRGRDHGLPPYNVWRDLCDLPKFTSFDQMKGELHDEAINALQDLYKNVRDVDLYPAGLSEKPLKDGILGPTFSCIIGKTFSDLKRGDRYWFENRTPYPNPFTSGQLQSLRKTSLAHVLCHLTLSTEIQREAMIKANLNTNHPVNCGVLRNEKNFFTEFETFWNP